MSDARPLTFDIVLPGGVPSFYDEHVVCKLSAMKGYYADRQSYEALLARDDLVLYEVYQLRRPETAGELLPCVVDNPRWRPHVPDEPFSGR